MLVFVLTAALVPRPWGPVVSRATGVSALAAQTLDMEVDVAHSTVAFGVDILGGMTHVEGKFTRFEVDLAYDTVEVAQSRVEVRIDAASVDTGNPGRDQHVRTDDFLDAPNHPQLVFTSTAVRPTPDGVRLAGDLTVRGVTRPVEFDMRRVHDPMLIVMEDGGPALAVFEGGLTLSRSDFDVRATPRWNRLLAATGQLAMSDAVEVVLRIVAFRPAPDEPSEAPSASTRGSVAEAGRESHARGVASGQEVALVRGGPIEVDGVVAEGEWADAVEVRLAMSDGGETTIRLKHDGSSLLVMFLGLGADPFRVPEVVLDVGADGGDAWGSDDWWIHASFTDCVGRGRFNAYDTCVAAAAELEANNLSDGPDGETVFPEAFEIRVPFESIGWDPGSDVPIAIAFNVTDTDEVWEFWPAGAKLDRPSTWAALTVER